MYAIIQDGGKQYKVAAGMLVELDKKCCEPGNTIEFTNVVYFHDKTEVKVGAPTVPGMRVKGIVEKHGLGPKITILFYRRTKDSRRKVGFRAQHTYVRIAEIVKE